MPPSKRLVLPLIVALNSARAEKCESKTRNLTVSPKAGTIRTWSIFLTRYTIHLHSSLISRWNRRVTRISKRPNLTGTRSTRRKSRTIRRATIKVWDLKPAPCSSWISRDNMKLRKSARDLATNLFWRPSIRILLIRSLNRNPTGVIENKTRTIYIENSCKSGSRSLHNILRSYNIKIKMPISWLGLRWTKSRSKQIMKRLLGCRPIIWLSRKLLRKLTSRIWYSVATKL